MALDRTPCAPSTGGKHQPAIPGRSSFISHASDTIKQSRQSLTPRYSFRQDDGRRLQFLSNDPTPTSTIPDQPRLATIVSLPSNMNKTSAGHSAPRRHSTYAAKVQRWAGLTRSVSNWDNLRKDPELWSQDGDCHVHLYARGASRRGPSFCVPLRALRQKNCGAMLDLCYAQTTVGTRPTRQESQRMHSFDNLNRGSGLVELYVPGPENASREEFFNWHLTTRNFFAYVLGKPLVGHHMGQTFVDLQERMQLFRSQHVNNHQEFLEYAENQGYRDLVECTDYALASLYYAEQYKLRGVWIDAFAHCVGMSDSLALSPEYMPISRLTKALIIRAHLEANIHLSRVAKALRTFLQEDFSPAFLGLTDAARNHLDHFRSFFHHFYVDKFGYWPPLKSVSPFPKVLYESMFYDFKNLYDYLADTDSTTDISLQRPASGGICVLQNANAFDTRHKFTAQPHPLPLLPNHEFLTGSTEPQKVAKSPSASHHRKTRDPLCKSAALAAATNRLDPSVMNSRIIQAYMQFEMTCATTSSHREARLTMVDARKVRWLLIYGTLQYLASVLRAPREVRDTDTPDYPLCCLVGGESSWNVGTPVSTPPTSTPTNTLPAIEDYFGAAQRSPFSIQPDCQRGDYFTSQTTSRRRSVGVSTPPRATLPTRQLSQRSYGSLSSLSGRSSRRNSLTLKPIPHCPIFVHGYGNGLNEATRQAATQIPAQQKTANKFCRSSKSNVLEGAKAEVSWLRPWTPPALSSKALAVTDVQGHSRPRTPVLHSLQLDQLIQPTDFDGSVESMNRSDSTSSAGSSVWTDGGSATSSKSSADGERQNVCKSSAAEHSGLLGGLVSVDGTPLAFNKSGTTTSTECLSQSNIPPLLRQASVRHNDFDFGFSTPTVEVHSIGVAFSAPPSPLARITSTSYISASVSRESLATEESSRHSNAVTADSVSALKTAPGKKSRGSDITSSFINTPIDVRERYNSAINQLENSSTTATQYGDMCNSSSSDSPPASITKTSHPIRRQSLRNRIWHDDRKLERRLSSLWRR